MYTPRALIESTASRDVSHNEYEIDGTFIIAIRHNIALSCQMLPNEHRQGT